MKRLCNGSVVGEIKFHYKVALHPGAKPSVVTYLGVRVPIPLMRTVSQELLRVEELGVTEKVKHATQSRAPMAVVRKKGA